MKRFARTAAEADLFVDLECEERGETPVSRKRRTVERRRQRLQVYEIRCQSGKLLEFEFEDGGLPEPRPGLQRKRSYGGAQPSLLIDPGDWMRVADRHLARAPGSVAGLAERARREAEDELDGALAAVDEVLKFLPAGADRIPGSAMHSARGKAYFEKDVRRFSRASLEALRADIEARLRRYRSSRV